MANFLTKKNENDDPMTLTEMWDRAMDEMFTPFGAFTPMNRLERTLGRIRMDIKDTGDAYVVEADMPGTKKEDIKVDINNDVLTITCERHHEEKTEDTKNHKYVQEERYHGVMRRCLDVSGVDTAKIDCAYTDGVLKLTLPKKEVPVPDTTHLEIK